MAKTKKLSLAIFETPTECRECPCGHITPNYRADLCKLAHRLIEPQTTTEPIPDWCPLKPVVFEDGYAK